VPRHLSIESLAAEVAAGRRVYLPGSAGEPTELVAAILADPERTRGLDLVTSAVPGINPLDLSGLAPDARVTGLFMQPGLADAQRAGRYRHLPVSYSGFVRHLAEGPPFDVCVVHVTPPDACGRCSLGAAVEFTPLAAARSRRIVGVVNPVMPRIPGAQHVVFADLEAVAESGAPLRSHTVGPASAGMVEVARNVAALIGNGVVLQVGLGKVPEALFAELHDRRGLRLHSGMLSDSLVDLTASGALDPSRSATTCVLVGSAALYSWLEGREAIAVQDCSQTHGAGTLGGIERFVAVNSALSVDLFGQCNLEIASGAAVSGVGGAPDFARAARQSRGGLSVVALLSTGARGTVSRVVPRLDDCVVSLPRADVDVVVTEHGSADLRGLSVHERAEVLTAVAAPAHRGALADAWREIAARL
jgi:acyl-CoA hydrolase